MKARALLILLVCVASAVYGEWREITTEYFSILFEPDDRESAELLSTFADDVYEDLSGYLGETRTIRIPVVIRAKTGDANAYFTYLPTRIVVFTATPSTPIVQPNLDQWLRIVFVHELTHYFQMSDPTGWGALSRVFGPSAGLVNLVFTPRWMAEGLALHTETLLSVGGRGRSPIFEMQYVAALLADDFWSFDQSFYGSDSAPRSRVYVGGYVLVDYIIRTYGIESLTRLSREYIGHPILGIRRAIRRALGIEAPELYENLVADLERSYGPRRNLPDGEVVSGTRGGYWFLVRGGTEIIGSPPLAFSRLISESDWADGLDGGDLLRSVPLETDPFSVSASDSVVVFTRPATEPLRPDDFVGFSDLWIMDRTTRKTRRITSGRRLYHPALSSDERFAVAIERTGAFSRLVRVDLDTGGVETIWDPGATWMASPSISPDGRTVVLAASTSGEQDLYLLSGGEVTQLTHSPGLAEMFPVYVAPAEIWFSAAAEGPLALWSLDLESGRFSSVLTDRDGVFYGTPTESGLVYQSYTETGPSVKRADTPDRTVVPWPDTRRGDAAAESPSLQENDDGGRSTEFTLSLPPDESRYVDWPTAEIWLPFVLPARSDGGLALEPGGLLVLASPLERNFVTASARLHTKTFTPTARINLLHEKGPNLLEVDVSTGPAYVSDTGLSSRLETAGTVTFARSILALTTPRATHGLGASAAASLIVVSGEGLNPIEQFSDAPDWFAGGTAGLSWASRRSPRIADLLGPPGLRVTAAATYLAPLHLVGTLDSGTVLAGSTSMDLRLPLGPAMVDLTGVFATGTWPGRIDTIRGNLILPRGAGDSDPVVETEPAILVRLAVDTPAWLLDLGFRGFNLTRLGLSLYAQQSIDYVDGGLGIRPETAAAIELAGRVGYLASSFVPAVGLVVIVPHADPLHPRLGLSLRNASLDSGFVVGR